MVNLISFFCRAIRKNFVQLPMNNPELFCREIYMLWPLPGCKEWHINYKLQPSDNI